MAGQAIPDDLSALIPEVREWNDGAGVTPEAWIGMMGTYELAVGYSLIFWPRFVQFDGYVLREGFSETSLRGFEQTTNRDRRSIEAVMNHVHAIDIHCNEPDPTEAQLRYLGRVLRDIHEVKLKSDFPHLGFVVAFNDEPGLDPADYQLTFWQTTD